MKRFGYIYLTTNLINSKVYIGKRKGNFTQSYLGSGKVIKRAIKKYGKQSFKCKILLNHADVKELNRYEIYYISKYRKMLGRDKVYNLTDGGDGGEGRCKGMIRIYNQKTLRIKSIFDKKLKYYLLNGWALGFPEKMKKNMSTSMKGRNHTNINCQCVSCVAKRGEQHRTEEQVKNQKEKMKKKKHIYNVKLKQSKMVETNLVPEYTAKGWVKGRPNISEIQLGKHRPSAVGQNISKALKGRKRKHPKDCKCPFCIGGEYYKNILKE